MNRQKKIKKKNTNEQLLLMFWTMDGFGKGD
jgi:hypothetical protein